MLQLTPKWETSEPSPKPQSQPHWLPGPLAPAELPRQSQPEETSEATSLNSLFFLLLHSLLHTLGLTAGTMQSPCCCLLSLLLYLLLLSGTWANLEGAFTLRLLQTSIFQNTSFSDMEGLGMLEDIKLGSFDKHTLSIRFCQPWVRPARPQTDWDVLENFLKAYMQTFNHLVNEIVMQRGAFCECPVFIASLSEKQLGSGEGSDRAGNV
ncbi:PREDICTED: uncharacterized protein LOC106853116 [Sturnus vulgaris]|uniref:uncharacterized protein LOC106853116 n=1 Tax=Sturnus vulgaris TaxID=9172 RepID=UPI00071A9EA7|nr:PREDICTED: uncharacterized protein LOC106853116 [Sturnus vulgaris]